MVPVLLFPVVENWSFCLGQQLVLLSSCKRSDRFRSSLMGHFALVGKWCYSSNVRIVNEQENKANSVTPLKWENCSVANQLGFLGL